MSLAETLDRQLDAMQRFVTLLREERQSLSQGEVDGPELERLAEAKSQVAAELETLDTERRRLLHEQGHGESRQSAERAATEAERHDSWQQLRSTGEEARQLNRINGLLAMNRMEQNQRMLNFLKEAAGSTMYEADGRSRHKGLNRISSRV
nr:flagella synthesis chaperone protein FlgN [Virgibacillus halodenitrificans]